MLVILLVEVVPGDRLLYTHAHWKDILNAQLLGQWMRSRDDFHGCPHLALIFTDSKKLVFDFLLDELIIQLELSLFFVLFLKSLPLYARQRLKERFFLDRLQ